MNKKAILAKVLSIILIGFMVFISLNNFTLAATLDKAIDVSQFDKVEFDNAANASVQRVITAIISIAQIVGIGVAIIMLIVLAIKYISAAPSEKAEIKKTVTIYVVGAVVLFAASGILEIIKKFATGNVKA